ncbi:hypothetical protein ACFLTQ_03225 [Chloroflexota bacterium]
MKKALLLLSSLLLIAGMVLVGTGCVAEDTNDASSTDGIASFKEYGTLQGKIMNANTGEAIGGDDLEVYLIEGTDTNEPDKLITDIEDIFVGEYAFEDVPVGLSDDTPSTNDELVFKLVVIHPDYQTYTTIINLKATLVGGESGGNEQINNTFTNEMFNFIQDIYLYPIGTVPGDVNVYIYGPDGKPISNASVYLRQSDYLQPSLTPDASDGNKHVFNSAKLALGGTYSIMVEPLTVDGQELTKYTGSSFTVGDDTLTRVVNMNVASGSQELFVTSASNQVPGTVTSDGVLTVKFNQPVILDTTEFGVSHDGNGVLNADNRVTASLSSDGMTLTLTPNFDTMPTDNGSSVTYSYSDSVYLKNSQANYGFGLFDNDVRILNDYGDWLSGEVLMISN